MDESFDNWQPVADRSILSIDDSMTTSGGDGREIGSTESTVGECVVVAELPVGLPTSDCSVVAWSSFADGVMVAWSLVRDCVEVVGSSVGECDAEIGLSTGADRLSGLVASADVLQPSARGHY